MVRFCQISATPLIANNFGKHQGCERTRAKGKAEEGKGRGECKLPCPFVCGRLFLCAIHSVKQRKRKKYVKHSTCVGS